MLVLSKNDIQKIFSMKEAILASKKALVLHSQGKSIVPLRVNLNIAKENGQCLFMPAVVEELDSVGIKIVSVFPNNDKYAKPVISAQMILLNGKNGEVSAMLDGTYLTQLRTGALQGAATDILARQDAKIAAIFGIGAQARCQLEALLTVRNLSEIRVVSRRFDSSQQFVEQFKPVFASCNVKMIAVENSNEAIHDADVIITATNSNTPVFDARFVKKGAHINGIGSFTPDMQELPVSLITRASKLVFDTREGVLAEAGDVIIPLKKKILNDKNLTGELGEILLNKIKGRETDQEITVFKSVGFATLDIVTAQLIYQKALDLDIGIQI